MARRQRLATAITLMVLTIAAQAEDFIRVDEDDSAARLQTAVTRFEKDGATVDLIGAVHIADQRLRVLWRALKEGRNVSAHADGEPMCRQNGFSSSFHPHGEHVSPLRDFFVLHPVTSTARN